MASVTLLHTADVHVRTFERLLSEAGTGLLGKHIVHDEWLAEARDKGLNDDLTGRISDFLRSASETSDLVLCTCSTLGPVADQVATTNRNVLRIDRPMMEKATSLRGTILVAFCLESTMRPTLDLLEDVARQTGNPANVETVLCSQAWPLFESGDTIAFGKAIARSVETAIAEIEHPSCVVLAQASMAAAEPFLTGLDVPVLTSPRLAIAALAELARTNSP